MIKVFFGDDRVRMLVEAGRLLGEGHEVVEGEGLGPADMVNVFAGGSLFADKRRILVKDLGESKEAFAELPKYLETENEMVLVESKLDKRGVVYKELVERRVDMREFRVAEPPEKKLVFDILDMAMRGEGKKAVEMTKKIEAAGQDVYMFFGLMVSQAIKKLEMGNRDARRVISLLAQTDVLMKSSSVPPWLLVQRVLVQISSGR